MKLKTIVAATLLGVSSFAANAATLDSLAGDLTFKLFGLTAENTLSQEAIDEGAVFGASLGWETTWGIGRVTTIDSSSTGTVYTAGIDGPYLNFMIYGIADASSTLNGSTYDLLNTGATKDAGSTGKIVIDVYKDSTFLNLNNQMTSSRCGYSCFEGITKEGAVANELYLRLELSPQYFEGDDVTTLYQSVSALNLPAVGSGWFYANVTGGTGQSKWDTGTIDNLATAIFDQFDFSGQYDLITIAEAKAKRFLTNTAATDFQGFISDPLSGNAIPEPGSIALAGLGLLGLAALRRRKQA